MAKNKPYEIPLKPDLASEILAHPAPGPKRTDYPDTINGRLQAALDAVAEANEFLKTSHLARIVADNLMKQLRKRGHPFIRVRADGTVILHVSYDEDDAPEEPVEPPVQRSSRKSDLPKLDELRAWADRIDVDISDLGRARRTIYERLVAAEDTAPAPSKTILRKKGKPEPNSKPENDASVDDLFADMG